MLKDVLTSLDYPFLKMESFNDIIGIVQTDVSTPHAAQAPVDMTATLCVVELGRVLSGFAAQYPSQLNSFSVYNRHVDQANEVRDCVWRHLPSINKT